MWKKFKQVLAAIGFVPADSPPFKAKTIKIGEQELVIRAIEEDDIKALLGIEREVYFGQLPWTKSAFLSELNSPLLHRYLLIESPKQVWGFIGCRVREKDCHITNVAVSPNQQGQGVGTYLLEEAKKFAIICGCDTMSLEVRINNNQAQRLYRKLGFVSKAIKRGYYTETNEDALDMQLQLKEV